MHGLEACGFDGAGEALRHIYAGDGRAPLVPPPNASAIVPAHLLPFDQLPFGMRGDSTKDMAFARTGYAYVPPRCRRAVRGGATAAVPGCRLHVFFHGCGSAFNSGASVVGHGFNDTFIAHAGFSAWAEANDIVVLFPQKDATKETCW